MSSINLTDITSGFNLAKVNQNFQEVERVINEELLHRVNTDSLPNTLQTTLDANSNPIINLPKPVSGGEPLRLKDLFGSSDELLSGPVVQHITATASQTVFTLSSNYVVGSKSLLVFRNGILLSNTEYTESSSSTITLTVGADEGDVVSAVPTAVSGGTSTSVVTSSNLGSGAGVFAQKIGNDLQFKGLVAGSGITIVPDATSLTIASTGSVGEANTASNLGATGEGVYASKSGVDLRFKKLKAGTNVTLASDADSITVSSSGGGGSGVSLAIKDNGVTEVAEPTSLNIVNGNVSSAGTDVTLTLNAATYLNVKDFGATGDGTTNDSTAIQSAITAAKAANKSVFFPDGSYVISSLGTQSGRLFLVGTGNSTLKGTFTYYDATFPLSADTNTPIATTSPYFSSSQMNFQSTTADYALKLSTVEQGGFLSTFGLSHCRFFGNKGLLAQHMIGFELNTCEFNNVVTGARVEGCVNGLWVNCRFQNLAQSGVWITSNAVNYARKGGENMRFVNCEWAVCTYGIVADQHMWLTLDSCLLDYCGIPLFLSGSNWAKAVNTYFGASNHAASRFSAVSGYVAPVITGVAVYGRPGTATGLPAGSIVSGFTAHNCEFINYITGSVQPIVYLDGYFNGSYPRSIDETGFYDCLFYATTTHSATTLLEISNVAIARVIGNRFRSANVSSTLTNAYRMNVVTDAVGHSNSFLNCFQSAGTVTSAYERPVGAVVSATDPGAIGAGVIWVTP